MKPRPELRRRSLVMLRAIMTTRGQGTYRRGGRHAAYGRERDGRQDPPSYPRSAAGVPGLADLLPRRRRRTRALLGASA